MANEFSPPAMAILNIQGLVPDRRSKQAWKIDYLRDYVSKSKQFLPIILLTETWLKSYHTGAQVRIPSYHPAFRSDRGHRDHGGVAAYVHEDLVVDEPLTFDNKYCEVVMLYLPKVKTVIINCYRPSTNCPFGKWKEAVNFIECHLNSVEYTNFMHSSVTEFIIMSL